MPVPTVYEDLTDDEIRSRLISFKCDVGPVNDFTRKVYIKKLAQLESSAGRTSLAVPASSQSRSGGSTSPSRNRTSRRSVGSTPAQTSKSPAREARRRTIAITPGPPHGASASSSPAEVSEEREEDDEDKGDVEVRRPPAHPASPPARSLVARRRMEQPRETDGLDSGRQPPQLTRRSVAPAPVPSVSCFLAPSPSRPHISAIAPPLRSLDRPARVTRADLSDSEMADERITGFRRRALMKPTVSLNASSYEPQSALPRSSVLGIAHWLPAVKATAMKNQQCLKNVLFVLIVIAVIGFLGMAAMKNPVDSDVYPVCAPTDAYNPHCVPPSELSEAVENFRALKPMLEKHAVMHDWPNCAEDPRERAIASVSRGVSYGEVAKVFLTRYNNIATRISKLRHVAALAVGNPRWGVGLLTQDGRRTDQLNLADGFEATGSTYPFRCLLSIGLQEFLKYGLIFAAAMAPFYGLYYLYRYYVTEKERKERAVYDMVEKIIMLLSSQRNKEQPYLTIYAVREQLIKPSLRNDPETLLSWQKASDFIETKEPRVVAEMNRVEGYDRKCWRFRTEAEMEAVAKAELDITENVGGNANQSMEVSEGNDVLMADVSDKENQASNDQTQRMWQGSAFDNNRLKTSPTPCLKIRNMFDPEVETGNDWPLQIQDSLLEKCQGIPVVHIAVDTRSREGTVYMKCLNEEAAGSAFSLLHGQWFDGQLVTVKYILQDRYHQRFPSAENSTEPIQR